MITEQQLQWVAYGIYFGFPRCCIGAFTFGSLRGNLDNRFGGSGFLECPECARKTEQQVCNLINAHRICPIPFSKALCDCRTADSKRVDALTDQSFDVYAHVSKRHAYQVACMCLIAEKEEQLATAE